MSISGFWPGLLGLLLVAGNLTAAPRFASDVLPLLEQRCGACHGPESPQRGLNLTEAAALIAGGDSGPAIQVGSSAQSLLISKIVSGSMPPGDAKLPTDEIELLREWIDVGAPQEARALGLELVTEADVLPILQARCVVCHGKGEKRGGLDLRTQASRLAGGDSGPAVVPGDPDGSLLIQKIEADLMPPPQMQYDYAVRNPTEAEMRTLREWVAAGCPPVAERDETPVVLSEEDKAFWSFVPPKRPLVPDVEQQSLVENPIDAFLLERLEARGLTYAPEAKPHELLRRAYLDLTGLPPTARQARAYLTDSSPGRYEQLIDGLLESSEYGERWARHWLDVAGYNEVESTSSVAPTRKHAWRFRDYVIRSLNADKPFDRFLMEQIAGDEMGPWRDQPVTQELVDRLAATGYLRTASDSTWEIEFAFLSERMDVLADQVQIVGSGLLGLTIGCARCHDHKYDPISQRDFYSMSAILQAAFDPYDWKQPQDRALSIAMEGERKQIERVNAPVQEKIDKLEASLEAGAGPFRAELLEERLGALPQGVRQDLRVVADTPEDARTQVQRYLANRFKQTLDISVNDLINRFEAFKTTAAPLRDEIRQLKRELKPEPKIRALTDMGGEPSTAYLLLRGDAMNPGSPIGPNAPAIASAYIEPYRPIEPADGVDSSGFRMGLARWLTQPDHPLVSRVLVNRMWMRHFGRGIVDTVDNFGKLGGRPSHPQLLDWLAVEFVEGGWTLKRMHRLMMTSRAYRQSARRTAEGVAADADNALVSRMAMRRMDADQLYDSLLLVTGRLDPKRFGPPAGTEKKDSGEISATPTDAGYRRSIYTLQHPLEPVTLLEAFDFPQMSPNCTMRSVSNVSTQALQLMNGERTWELARYWAGRVIDEAGPDRSRQVELVFEQALARVPTEAETQQAVNTVEEFERRWLQKVREERRETPVQSTASWLAVANLCHTVLNSAEFAFID